MLSVTEQHFQEKGAGGSNRVIMDSRHALQWTHTHTCGAQPMLTVVILIMQSQANGSMVAVMMLSNCTK